MPQYDKLVRDRIPPEIIKNEGKRLTITTLEESEYLAQLDRKLQEELAEYLAAETFKAKSRSWLIYSRWSTPSRKQGCYCARA